MRQLWVDTDLGFDDMHALLVLHCHHIKPVACSLVFGCAELDQVQANASGFEKAFNYDGVWHRGASSALDGNCRTAAHVLGPTGMQSRGHTLDVGDQLLPTTTATATATATEVVNTKLENTTINNTALNNTALKAMITWLSADPVKPEVLALGPLTNLAHLIKEAPQLASKLHRITWMGGSEGRGNQTEYAEFNAWADAEAAAIVMESGIHVRIVELEACRQVQLIAEDLKLLSTIDTEKARLLHDLLGGYLDIGVSRGRTGMAVYDPVAAAAVVLAETNPTLTTVPVNISVNTTVERAGQTHIERSNKTLGAMHSLVQVTDAAAARALVLDSLVRCAKDDRTTLNRKTLKR